MIEYYFGIYENGGGYIGVVYDDEGERVEDFWKVEKLFEKQEFFYLGTELGLLRIRSSEVKVFCGVDGKEKSEDQRGQNERN